MPEALTLAAYQAFVRVGVGTQPDREHFALGLAGEVGEFANAAKKRRFYSVSTITRENLISEAGDCLWYLFACVEVWAYKAARFAGVETFQDFERVIGERYFAEIDVLHVQALRLFKAVGPLVDSALCLDEFPMLLPGAFFDVLKRLAQIVTTLNLGLEDLARLNMAKAAELRPDVYADYLPARMEA